MDVHKHAKRHKRMANCLASATLVRGGYIGRSLEDKDR